MHESLHVKELLLRVACKQVDGETRV